MSGPATEALDDAARQDIADTFTAWFAAASAKLPTPEDDARADITALARTMLARYGRPGFDELSRLAYAKLAAELAGQD